ncbi:MAG: hypothetical protein U0232_27470 [Thermomicrobiales bacterium]
MLPGGDSALGEADPTATTGHYLATPSCCSRLANDGLSRCFDGLGGVAGLRQRPVLLAAAAGVQEALGTPAAREQDRRSSSARRGAARCGNL